jgi:hypothetical protein
MSSAIVRLVDHLVYATPDLDAACADLEARLGVRPSVGGQHLGRGTRNALVACGPDCYLEIVGPDPAQPPPPNPRWFGIDDLSDSRLVAWAARATNIATIVSDAARRGVILGAPATGGRRRPDGVALAWEVTDPTTVVADGIVPFFIDWRDSPHPATTAVRGPTLVDLRTEHPDPAHVQTVLRVLGLEMSVDRGARPALIAHFETKAGVVELR